MSVLGVGGELALLAGDTMQPSPRGSAGSRSKRAAPLVKVQVSIDDTSHRLQDVQSLALHEEAVRQVKANPELVQRTQEPVASWLAKGDARSASLWVEWQNIF